MVPPSSLAAHAYCLDSSMSMHFLPDQCKIASFCPAIMNTIVVHNRDRTPFLKFLLSSSITGDEGKE